MKRSVFVRGAGWGLACIAAVGLVSALVLYGVTASRLGRHFEISPSGLQASQGPEAVALGQHLAAAIMGCTDCHGADLGGKVMIPGGPMGIVAPPNLTTGQGGLQGYEDEDYVRAIRHGVARDGRPLFFMPSSDYHPFSDEELRALMAYLRSVPPVDRELPPTKPGPLARLLLVTGELKLSAEEIDHTSARAPVPARGPTREYGAVLVSVCMGCHGETLAGGPIPGVPPDWPPAANISPHPQAGIGAWTEPDFVRAMREGLRPNGSKIDERMPWKAFSGMTDDELHALWLLLRSAPPAGGA